jgi:hypothetical protein
MRFLPYALVAAMAAPLLVWFIVQSMMVKGTQSGLGSFDFTTVGALLVLLAAAFGLLSTWMHKFIAKTGG